MIEGERSRRAMLAMLLIPLTGCAALTEESEPEAVRLGDVRIYNMTSSDHRVRVTVARDGTTVVDETYRVEPPEGPEARILIEPTWNSEPAIYDVTADLLGTESTATIEISSNTVDENWEPCRGVAGDITDGSGQGASIGLSPRRPPGNSEEEYCTAETP